MIGWHGSENCVHFLPAKAWRKSINLPFTTDSLNRRFAGLWQNRMAAWRCSIRWPRKIAEMRHSLFPGLIENLRLNLAHKPQSFHAYHLGKVFDCDADGETEETAVCQRNALRTAGA